MTGVRHPGDQIEALKQELKADLRAVAEDVGAIRDMLISEPEASPLGRALLRRIEHIERRADPMYDWWNQTKGTWRAVTGLAVILGIVATTFAIMAYFGIHPAT